MYIYYILAITQANLVLSFEEVLRAVHQQHRFAIGYKVVEPFENLNWKEKLKLQLWGGEKYRSQDSLKKVINSQNCRVAIYYSYNVTHSMINGN